MPPGHPRCRNRLFPLKIELPLACPSVPPVRLTSGLRQLRFIWKPGLTLSNTGFFRLSLHGGGGGGDGKWLWPVTLELFNRLKPNLVH